MGCIRIPLEAGGIYHIYNRAIGSEKLFRKESNYIYFLKKFHERTAPFAKTLAFCQLPNHFHFILRIKNKEELEQLWSEKLLLLTNRHKINNLDFRSEVLLHKIMIAELGSMFSGYSQAYNKMYSRTGALLKESFQRKLLKTNEQLIRAVCFIHNTPVALRFALNRESWKFSSYSQIINSQNTIVASDETLELLGGKENFISLHNIYGVDESVPQV